jgi:hypothetical protein
MWVAALHRSNQALGGTGANRAKHRGARCYGSRRGGRRVYSQAALQSERVEETRD